MLSNEAALQLAESIDRALNVLIDESREALTYKFRIDIREAHGKVKTAILEGYAHQAEQESSTSITTQAGCRVVLPGENTHAT